MRSLELALIALLSGGTALAHGVHDLRGEVRLDSSVLRIEIELDQTHREEATCLRLLDELQVLTAGGRRLIGTQEHDADSGRCSLDYPLLANAETLKLQLRAREPATRRHERLILASDGRALVLSNRGPARSLDPSD